MMDLPLPTYSDSENSGNGRLYRLLAIVFVVFLIIGGLIAYTTSLKLNKNEADSSKTSQVQTTAPVTYKGTVTYLGVDMYANDQITYSLTDAEGNDIILLKANDEKLSIAQGLFVTVTGKRGKTLNGEQDVLQVTEVTINNGTN